MKSFSGGEVMGIGGKGLFVNENKNPALNRQEPFGAGGELNAVVVPHELLVSNLRILITFPP